MSKKILSVALALIFVISTFAVSAFAVGGATFEEDADAYTQAWRLEDLGETDGTYSVGVYLETNYKVGAIQFQIANDDGNAVLEGVDSEIFAAPDFDVQWTEDGLVFIVPTPVDSGATAVDATTEILVATLSYTLKDGASSASLAIVDDAKSEANPGGSLIAVRMSDDNLVTGTMIYGQTATVEEGITIGAAAVPAELALTATGTTDGVVIDTTKTFGGAYAGVIYGFKQAAANTFRSKAYITNNLTATNGGSLTVKNSSGGTAGVAWGTGSTVEVINADNTSTGKVYVICIFADINGDGFTNASDVTQIKNASTNSSYFAANSLKRLAANASAVNATLSHTTNAADLTAIKRHATGVAAIDFAALATKHASFTTYYK